MTTRRLRAFAVFYLLFCIAACRPDGIPSVSLASEENALFTSPPRRVVSLYPTASEILAALDVSDLVVGITIHGRNQPGLENKPMVGGFAKPDIERILALSPDCVIATPFHSELIDGLRGKGIPVLLLDTVTLADGAANIRKLGKLVGREKEAEALVIREQGFLNLAAAKTTKLAESPGHRSLRAIRLMGFSEGSLLVPGDDSFQNELIKNAGGQPPSFGKNGPVIAISPEEWRAFDPEAVYYCGYEPETVRQNLGEPAWAGVAAQEKGTLFSYPCDLICRAATHHGYFSLWLSSDLYGKEYSEPKTQVTADAVLSRKRLDVFFAFVGSTEVLESQLFDVPAKTLLLRFTEPQTVLSSLSGWSSGITAVGNHYSSPPSWSMTYHLGLEKADARTMAMLGLQRKKSVFLYTGANMDNLAYVEHESDGLRVGVLATAGVLGNAMRSSVDTGIYVEPGTINLIILTNRKLSPAAMTSAIITATEAKTAALEDLDVRSSYTGTAATGTGTDNVLVVSSDGAVATMTGGHTKLGELMAKAVYAAVREAIEKQNRLYPQRDIFQRLAEHKIAPVFLFSKSEYLRDETAKQALAAAIEKMLLLPRYTGFLEMALAVSDSHERNLVQDMGTFSQLCLVIAGELAGKSIAELDPVIMDTSVPPVMREALNALATGILRR